MLRFRASGALLLMLPLFPLFPAGAEAQTGVPTEGDGWIGIQVEGRALPDGSTRVMIVRVDRGSPAQQAGVRPFDLLLRLDGEEVSPEALLELGERLRPGLPLQLTVLRGERERTLRVIAGARPDPMDPATMEEFTARVDSARLQILRIVDSLMADTSWARVRSEATRRAMVEQAEAAGELEATAEVMARVREMMVRAREAMRSQRFRRPPPPGGPPPARVRITIDETAVGERRSRGGPPDRGPIVVGRRGSGERRGPGGPPPGVRFRSPYLLGDRFVAGAELEVVEPDAPAGTGGPGLQVVQVLEGSPADRAGLAPEDLIVTIGGEPVGNLREFRVRLGRLILRGRPEMQVVRGDSTLVVILPRP